MRLDMPTKPDTGEETNEGTYSEAELAGMLDTLMEAKKIQDDPQMLAAVKDYAMSKHKMITGLFPAEENKAPKKLRSFDDLRKKANSMK